MRPIALGQAQVSLDFGIAPVFRTDPAAYVEGQRLPIRQSQTQVQALSQDTGLQAQADIRQGHGLAFERLEGDLAVEHRQARDRAHPGQQLLRVQGLVAAYGQAFQCPVPLLVFLQA
ncbi:hypothetical protein D3C85_1026340 [compost metagenome]